MKLKELVTPIFEELRKTPRPIMGGGKAFVSPDILDHGLIEGIRKELLNCREFKNCKSFEILNKPTFIDSNGKGWICETIKLGEFNDFRGQVLLYSIFQGPEIFVQEKFYEPVKDGCSITPMIYDPTTFEPSQRIMLGFNPEDLQDRVLNFRKELHETLDKILDNPNEYQLRGERPIMVRGLFGKDIELNQTEPVTQCQIFYLVVEHQPITMSRDNRVNISMKSKFVPIKVGEKFKAEFGDKLPYEDELIAFFERNK
jgi:hypothetical protein